MRQLLALVALVKREMPLIRTPALIIHPANDDVASKRNALYVERHLGGPKRLILLDDSYHMITVDKQRNDVIRAVVDYFAGMIEPGALAAQPEAAARSGETRRGSPSMNGSLGFMRRWLASLQGKLIIASLLISLVPTSIAAELAVRLVTHVVDGDVQTFLKETSVLFLNNFKESKSEAEGLARFLYEQKRPQTEPVVTADPAFLHLIQTMGYGVVVVSDADHLIFMRITR